MSRTEATGDRVLALQVLQQAIADASAEPTGRGKARARWCAMVGVEAEYLALRVAKLAVSWANSARRRRLGLPPQ